MTPADELRQAALFMRQVDDSVPDWADHVAHWLDDTAITMRCDGCGASQRSCSFAVEFRGKIKCCPDCGHGQAALAVARAYMQEVT